VSTIASWCSSTEALPSALQPSMTAPRAAAATATATAGADVDVVVVIALRYRLGEQC
jgi:hypothetical protein